LAHYFETSLAGEAPNRHAEEEEEEEEEEKMQRRWSAGSQQQQLPCPASPVTGGRAPLRMRLGREFLTTPWATDPRRPKNWSSLPFIRGLHSSTSQLNLRRF